MKDICAGCRAEGKKPPPGDGGGGSVVAVGGGGVYLVGVGLKSLCDVAQ